MLNTIYRIPDETDSRKHVYICIFFMNVGFGRRDKKAEFIANAALCMYKYMKKKTRFFTSLLAEEESNLNSKC